MINKAKYVLNYTVDEVPEKLEVIVSIEKILPETYVKRMNIFHGVVYINGNKSDKYDLKHSVNALFSVDEIGKIERDNLKKKYVQKESHLDLKMKMLKK